MLGERCLFLSLGAVTVPMPEPAGGPSMPIGKWLRLKGYELKPNQNRAPPGSWCRDSADA